MGYFSNGSEGEGYLVKYCFKCKEWRDRKDGKGAGCPVMDVHVLYAYSAHDNEQARGILDFLIPPTQDGLGNDECSMFNPIGAKGQSKLTPETILSNIIKRDHDILKAMKEP